MNNKEAMEILTQIKNTSQITWSNRSDVAFDLAIEALEKDKCSSCKHYDKDYGETCLNPEGTCHVFYYERYEEKENETDN